VKLKKFYIKWVFHDYSANPHSNPSAHHKGNYFGGPKKIFEHARLAISLFFAFSQCFNLFLKLGHMHGKMLIDRVRSSRTGKYLALGHL